MAPCGRSAPAMLPVPFLLGGWDGEHEIIRAAAVASWSQRLVPRRMREVVIPSRCQLVDVRGEVERSLAPSMRASALTAPCQRHVLGASSPEVNSLRSGLFRSDVLRPCRVHRISSTWRTRK